jgi:hypothetical protein
LSGWRFCFFLPCLPSKVPSCVGHLALTEFCKKHFVDLASPALRAKNGFFEIGAHGLFVDPYLAHVAIEFLAALFALKVDGHIIPVSSSSFSPTALRISG